MPDIRVLVVPFGCQMNKLDAEHLEGQFRRRRWARAASEAEADVVVYVTCSVRRKPEEKVFSRLAQVPRRDGRPILCVAGCMAQRMGRAVLAREPRVSLVIGTGELGRAGELVAAALAGGDPVVAVGGDGDPGPREPSERPHPFQAFVAVSRGCSKACAYCVVPATRGPERSRPPGDVAAEARALLADGAREIALIAQSISGFGRDLSPPSSLASLLREVHELPGLLRLRFLTSHPADLSEETLLALRDLPRACPHLHLPAQSGSDRVLAAMGRGYSRADYLRIVARARALVPGVEFTSDFIVGFPGETADDFEATRSLVREAGFQNVFVFKYSSRPATPAASLPDDVPAAEKLRRNHVLLADQEEISRAAQAAFVGREVEVLVEGPSPRDPRRLAGRTAGNRIVVFPGDPALAGRLVRVRIESSTPLTLAGREAR